MSIYIGIDLGTTYSAVATIDATGRPRIIENNGSNITASCVALENDQLIVGEIPESHFGHKGFDIGARFKRHMGEEHLTVLGKKSFSPTDLSAAVLLEMKKIAEKEVSEVAEAVITIPANFMQEARDATMHAAKKAGLNVKFIINEPTAAALYYGYKEGSALSGNIVVYDLGGGTFDVSVVNIENENIEVLATEGVSKLGGDDFDKAIQEIVKHKFKEITGKLPEETQIPLSAMAQIKIKLSERTKTPFMVDGEIIEISRSEFEEAIAPLINQAEYLCETVLEEANLEASEIKAVLLAGGSTRIPSVKRSIEKIFRQTPKSTENVDEVVALGAALYAAMKSSGEHLSRSQSASINKLKVAEISTYYFGTLSIDFNNTRNSEELLNSIIINKGERIPCSQTSQFRTVSDSQKAVHCRVTKSGSPETDPRFVSIVWEGELELPEDRPAGQVIEITYSFDENGMMNCEFLDVESGRKTKIDLDSHDKENGSSEIDQFLIE